MMLDSLVMAQVTELPAILDIETAFVILVDQLKHTYGGDWELFLKPSLKSLLVIKKLSAKDLANLFSDPVKYLPSSESQKALAVALQESILEVMMDQGIDTDPAAIGLKVLHYETVKLYGRVNEVQASLDQSKPTVVLMQGGLYLANILGKSDSIIPLVTAGSRGTGFSDYVEVDQAKLLEIARLLIQHNGLNVVEDTVDRATTLYTTFADLLVVIRDYFPDYWESDASEFIDLLTELQALAYDTKQSLHRQLPENRLANAFHALRGLLGIRVISMTNKRAPTMALDFGVDFVIPDYLTKWLMGIGLDTSVELNIKKFGDLKICVGRLLGYLVELNGLQQFSIPRLGLENIPVDGMGRLQLWLADILVNVLQVCKLEDINFPEGKDGIISAVELVSKYNLEGILPQSEQPQVSEA